jgi:hypothetical protein
MLCHNLFEFAPIQRQWVMKLDCQAVRRIGGGWESTAEQWLFTL